MEVALENATSTSGLGTLSLDVKTNEPAFLALTSLTVNEFELLVPEFENAFQAHMSKWCLDGKLRTKRRYTTYQNCPLPTAEERLLFILSYVKGNPLQSHHGLLFGLRQGKANIVSQKSFVPHRPVRRWDKTFLDIYSWIHVLLPVLRATCRTLGVAPARSVEELANRFSVALPGKSEAPIDADGPSPFLP